MYIQIVKLKIYIFNKQVLCLKKKDFRFLTQFKFIFIEFIFRYKTMYIF